MGPQAWASVGRAIGVVMAKWALDPRKGGAAVLLTQIKSHIHEKEYDLARTKLQHLKRRHEQVYDEFMDEFGDELDL